ncbi:MAG: OB-fold nucleic acid binding domain-containing protein, partial [Candidatus Palauibacterales bacterium]|nr:OB-fold nucleic acid binding domain-containing protein [Candidatus Palauibacterales bacterium]
MQTTFTSVRDLASKAGQETELRGWVAGFRSSGKIAFLELRDGTGSVQVVIARNEVDDASWEAVSGLALESSVRVAGVVRQDDRAPGGYEITASEIELVGGSEEYP